MLKNYSANKLCFLSFQNKASKRKNVLDEAYGQQGFLADSRDLVNFSLFLKCIENREACLRDVKTFRHSSGRDEMHFKVCVCKYKYFNFPAEKKS